MRRPKRAVALLAFATATALSVGTADAQGSRFAICIENELANVGVAGSPEITFATRGQCVSYAATHPYVLLVVRNFT